MNSAYDNTFRAYQIEARKTAIYPSGMKIIYPTLGLCGECGETAEKVKKIIRDKNGFFDDNAVQEIEKELGDVLWYIANIAYDLDLNLDDIAQKNLFKLQKRQEEGKLKGSGDNR